MTRDSGGFLGPLQVKDITALIGLLGHGYTYFTKMSGKDLVAVSMFSSLFILIWGIQEIRGKRSKIVKTFAWLGLIIGAPTVGLFLIVGSVLTFGEAPTAFGRSTGLQASRFELRDSELTDRVSGSYTLRFDRQADVAEVGIVPVEADREGIQELDITTKGALEQTKNITLILNKTNDIETYYEVVNPSQSFNVVLNCTAHLKKPSASPRITFLVYNSYGKRDWLWKLTTWVFAHYGDGSH